MKVLTPGHKYELENFEAKDQPGQAIRFIEKKPDLEKGNGVLFTVNDGTTNEEVIRMLVDRLVFQNAKLPCAENCEAVASLKDALTSLENRTKKRMALGVEGTNKPA